jgi:hypothetical protein
VLRSNSSTLALRRCKQILLASIDFRRAQRVTLAIINVVKPRAVVVVVVEELGIEWDSPTVRRCVDRRRQRSLEVLEKKHGILTFVSFVVGSPAGSLIRRGLCPEPLVNLAVSGLVGMKSLSAHLELDNVP